jgi:CheY-like chemotaxis protein
VDLPCVESRSESAVSTNSQVSHTMMLPNGATLLLPSTAGSRSVSRSTSLSSQLASSSVTRKRSRAEMSSMAFPGCEQTTDSCYANIRVLVAEDNKINQKVLKRMLFRLRLEQIDIVDNGQEAVDREATQTYDVILMDMDMPVMDGLEATRQIVARPRVELKDVAPKIFFVTAHALDTFQAQAKAAGGHGFISKPFNLQMIKSVFSESKSNTPASVAA